jgi:hypothetical protein
MTPAAILLATTLAVGMSPPLLGYRASPPIEYDPNIYAAALGTEVTYDDLVAQRYDDGYEPEAFAPFEQVLAPYGTWISDRRLGRVWVPSVAIVGSDFGPYATNGRWVLTEYGWTWDSSWDWGWAPFHFGRWAMLNDQRWCWVPGTLWAPAWVTWRIGRTHVGWAPLPPRGMRVGRPIGIRSPWTFARLASFGGPTLDLVPRRAVPAIFVHTAVLSKARSVSTGNLRVRVPAGPDPARCFTPEVQPIPLSLAAPGARPRVPIEPRRGRPLETRPWSVAGWREQTPIVPWPAPGRS